MTVHSLGLEWSDPNSGRVENVVLIPRGSELPCGTLAKALTDRDGQSTILCDCSKAKAEWPTNARHRPGFAYALPAACPGDRASTCSTNFTPEGRLQVKAQLPSTGQPCRVSVRREHGLMRAATDRLEKAAGAAGRPAFDARAVDAHRSQPSNRRPRPPGATAVPTVVPAAISAPRSP